MPFEFDETNQDIVAFWQWLWNNHNGPRVGDIVYFPDGHKERFAYDWGDGIQTCKGGSFCMHWDWVSMSGSLNPSVKKNRLVDTGTQEPAWFWLFHHMSAGAHRGVDFQIPVRVFKYLGEE